MRDRRTAGCDHRLAETHFNYLMITTRHAEALLRRTIIAHFYRPDEKVWTYIAYSTTYDFAAAQYAAFSVVVSGPSNNCDYSATDDTSVTYD